MDTESIRHSYISMGTTDTHFGRCTTFHLQEVCCPCRTIGFTLPYSFPSQRQETSVFSKTSRPDLGPTYPHMQRSSRAVSSGLKQSRHEAEHSPLFTAEVKDECSYTSPPPIRLHGVHRDSSNFSLFVSFSVVGP
jgi:hypothetical protein